MMAADQIPKDLISRLPRVRGSYVANAPLYKVTWLKVGGPAEVMFRPADENDLKFFLSARPFDVPTTIIGVGSNLLVRDGGVPGVVIRLGREFAFINKDGLLLKVGAGALDINVARVAEQAGLGGLEFLTGIPGTIGGGLRMNGGAYGSEFKDIFVSARAVDNHGELHELFAEDMGFGYRKTTIREDWLFIDAVLKGVPEAKLKISQRMDKIKATREKSQPVRTPTGGSTFANPSNAKAWELIDAAGCRGLVRGDAMVSEKHCNFLINKGNAAAADLESLGEDVRRRVFEKSGITLEWEIRRIGIPLQSLTGEGRQ
jgi:UDP-N-acetylmuramate dehydrogenase